MLFGTRSCLVCHGWNAVAGGGAPDLRYSPTITDAATFRQVVKQGALRMNGMPDFPALSDAELETMRFYLRARAKAAPAERAALLAKAASGGSNARAGDYQGTWDIVIQTPVGEQKAAMVLSVSGDKLTGTVSAEQGNVDVSGSVANGRAQLSGRASMPMPITIEYDLGLQEGKLSGDNRNGPFGTFPVAGSRRK